MKKRQSLHMCSTSYFYRFGAAAGYMVKNLSRVTKNRTIALLIAIDFLQFAWNMSIDLFGGLASCWHISIDIVVVSG